jgi:hypothetical protein
MRTLLTVTVVLLAVSANLTGQKDFVTLDKKTYDSYIRGDYTNLKKTADIMLKEGFDYYFLRMRLGILSFNKQLYSSAFRNFSKALEFNSSDTISREYIYDSYIFSGRNADADLYLESVPQTVKNKKLTSIKHPFISGVYAVSSVSGYDNILYDYNIRYYEAIKSSFGINAGFETRFSSRLKGTFGYTNYHKTGTVYSSSFPTGRNLLFNQNQVYARLACYIFPGWEISGFSHFAFYSDAVTNYQETIEFLGGAGISKTGWKIRTGANFSISNFSNSNQIRGEAYFTWLPSGNLNFYLTSGWMGQTDKSWGGSYQIDQEIGIRVFKFLWLESGILRGNSFLYARNMGSVMNNSFLIPATTIFGNIIILPGKKISITLTPFYNEYSAFSWDLSAFNRSNELILNSFGGAIKIIYKNN